MRPEPTVSGRTAALVAVVVVAALALTFAALAGEDDARPRPTVVTISG
jgi:uncharacterized protein YggE